MTSTAPLGFVGLGAIGLPLVRALRDAGFDVAVFDLRPEAVAEAVAIGCTACPSAAAVADTAETVFVSLPTPDVVRDVACGSGGLSDGRCIRTYVDLSTTGAKVAAEVAAQLSGKGIVAIDAPVSGGVAGAEARTLAVMVAGNQAAAASVVPLLETFGANVFYVGDQAGQGQVAKLLNNLLSATAVAITSEALALGVECGLDPATLLDVFNAGSGRNTATSDKFPKHVLTRRFASGFRLRLMAKDVDLCRQEAHERGLPMPLGAHVQQLWSIAARELDADADHTEYVRLAERWSGRELPVRDGVHS